MSNALKVTTVGTDPLASDVAQLANLFNAALEAGLMQLAAPQSTPVAPTVADAAVAGNLNGTYLWKIVLVTGWKQSDGSYYVSGFAPSADSASLSLNNSQASLSSIGTGTIVVIGRAIYRTAAGGAAGTEKFAGIIWDNGTTTWTDNVADASLGTGMPSSSSSPAAYGTAIPSSVPATNTTGTYLIGYLRTDSGAPNPQTVMNPVVLSTFTAIGDSTDGYIQMRTDANAVYLEAMNGSQNASKTLKLTGYLANPTPVETANNILDDDSGNMMLAGGLKVTTENGGSTTNTIQIYDSTSGASAYLRAKSGGGFEMVNNAYNATPFGVDDAGNLQVAGGINGTGPAHISYSNTFSVSSSSPNITITISGLNSAAVAYAFAITGLMNRGNLLIIGNGSSFQTAGGAGTVVSPDGTVTSVSLSGGTLTIQIAYGGLTSTPSNVTVTLEGLVL